MWLGKNHIAKRFWLSPSNSFHGNGIIYINWKEIFLRVMTSDCRMKFFSLWGYFWKLIGNFKDNRKYHPKPINFRTPFIFVKNVAWKLTVGKRSLFQNNLMVCETYIFLINADKILTPPLPPLSSLAQGFQEFLIRDSFHAGVGGMPSAFCYISCDTLLDPYLSQVIITKASSQ